MTAVTWSPGKQTAVVAAGCADGSLVLWDLRGGESMQKGRYSANLPKDVQLFDPCYTLCQSTQQGPAHADCIVSVDMLRSIGDDDGGFGSTQVVSVDKSGRVIYWILVEMSDSAEGSDPAVWPGGRLRLQPIQSFANILRYSIHFFNNISTYRQ